MTREEAKKELSKLIFELGFEDNVDDRVCALNMAIQALSQEPICDRDCEHCTWTECPIEPCDEKRDCSTCKYEHNDGHTQPCRDCGTLLESYTNWEQKERELPCIYDLKNRYCPRLNEHGMLKYPLQEQTTPMSDIDGIKTEIKTEISDYEGCADFYEGIRFGLRTALEIIDKHIVGK